MTKDLIIPIVLFVIGGLIVYLAWSKAVCLAKRITKIKLHDIGNASYIRVATIA